MRIIYIEMLVWPPHIIGIWQGRKKGKHGSVGQHTIDLAEPFMVVMVSLAWTGNVAALQQRIFITHLVEEQGRFTSSRDVVGARSILHHHLL